MALAAGSCGVLSGTAIAPASIFRDLLIFAFRHSSGNVSRITLAVVVMSLHVTVSRRLSQYPCYLRGSAHRARPTCLLRLCACRDGRRMASIQAMEDLRCSGSKAWIDWKLQAGGDRPFAQAAGVVVSRIYRPAILSIDRWGSTRHDRILTGRVLRGMIAGCSAGSA